MTKQSAIEPVAGPRPPLADDEARRAEDAAVAAQLRRAMANLACAIESKAEHLALLDPEEFEDRDVRQASALTLSAQRCKEMTDQYERDRERRNAGGADRTDWRLEALKLLDISEGQLKALVEKKRAADAEESAKDGANDGAGAKARPHQGARAGR